MTEVFTMNPFMKQIIEKANREADQKVWAELADRSLSRSVAKAIDEINKESKDEIARQRDRATSARRD